MKKVLSYTIEPQFRYARLNCAEEKRISSAAQFKCSRNVTGKACKANHTPRIQHHTPNVTWAPNNGKREGR